MTPGTIEQLEIDLLFEALYRRYGYDFRNYSAPSAQRRVRHLMVQEGLETVAELQHRVLHEPPMAEFLLRELSINVTEMFRDPPFYQALRRIVLPWLHHWGHLKVWHAGCATGEEAYSMAILLTEAGLYDRSLIYATDFNNIALDKAKSGIFPLERMALYGQNYRRAGGKAVFSSYYHANYERAMMNKKLKKSLVFANHNLVTDASFGEMQLVVCRNVLIYFDRELQERVLQLFTDSLCDEGILCLGSHETLHLSTLGDRYQTLDPEQRIYRKAA